MASRIEIENEIKRLADKSWFMPSQLALYEELKPFLGGFHRVVNIYGLQGVGKTFLAHVLCKESVVDYVPSPESIHPAEFPLVVDNAAFERTAVRGMRNQMRRHDLKQVLIITRYRAEDDIPAFELDITPDDVRLFRANLFQRLDFDLRLPDCSALNLWEHFKLIGGLNG